MITFSIFDTYCFMKFMDDTHETQEKKISDVLFGNYIRFDISSNYLLLTC